MLGFIFGLNARLGRLHYFFSTIGVAVVMTAICFAIAMSVYNTNPQTMLTFDAIKWPVIATGVFFFAVNFTLQSMRIRDIGWDPVCVIPMWIAVLMIDMVVARKFPALSLGPEHHGTAVGALVNLALFLALLFWPSGDYDEPMSGYNPPRPLSEPPRQPSGDAMSTAQMRIARASGEFGRRPS